MKENKKSVSIGKKILTVLLAVVVAVGVFGAIIGIKTAVEDKKYADSLNNVTTEKIKISRKDKVFSTDKFSITLTEDFEVFEDEAAEVGAVAKGIEVYAIADTFEEGSEESKMNATEYVESLVGITDTATKMSDHNGVPYVDYKYKGENDDVVKNYKVFCYKGEDCFWMVHFITESGYSNVYKPHIFEWVETIEAK